MIRYMFFILLVFLSPHATAYVLGFFGSVSRTKPNTFIEIESGSIQAKGVEFNRDDYFYQPSLGANFLFFRRQNILFEVHSFDYYQEVADIALKNGKEIELDSTAHFDIKIFRLAYGYNIWESGTSYLTLYFGAHQIHYKYGFDGDLEYCVPSNLSCISKEEMNSGNRTDKMLINTGFILHNEWGTKFQTTVKLDYYDFTLKYRDDLVVDLKLMLNYDFLDLLEVYFGFRFTKLVIDQEVSKQHNLINHQFVGPFISLHYYYTN